MGSEKYWQDKYPAVSDRIKYIFLERMFTDFVIIINDNNCIKEFNVHKVFLACASPYFESSLFGPLRGKPDSLVLDDVDYHALEGLLSYIYTDEPALANINQAINIYRLADRFLMDNLKQICRDFIIKAVDSRTVLQVLENFKVYNDDLIYSACQKIIKYNTTSIILCKEFEQISKETLLLILNEDNLKIKSETQLYKATERWLEAEISRRDMSEDSLIKKFFYEIVENIRFKSIPEDEFPRSNLLVKYLAVEDKQQILSSHSSDSNLPGNFCQKKRGYIQDNGPPKAVAELESQTLPHDWRQRLQASVARGDMRSLKQLIRAGADVTVKYNNGTTLLHIASHRCKVEIVSCLIDHGLPVNTIDGSGYTALHIAALWGKLEIVQLLLERGADPTMNNTEGQTPLDIANSQPHPCHREIRDILMARITP